MPFGPDELARDDDACGDLLSKAGGKFALLGLKGRDDIQILLMEMLRWRSEERITLGEVLENIRIEVDDEVREENSVVQALTSSNYEEDVLIHSIQTQMLESRQRRTDTEHEMSSDLTEGRQAFDPRIKVENDALQQLGHSESVKNPKEPLVGIKIKSHRYMDVGGYSQVTFHNVVLQQ